LAVREIQRTINNPVGAQRKIYTEWNLRIPLNLRGNIEASGQSSHYSVINYHRCLENGPSKSICSRIEIYSGAMHKSTYISAQRAQFPRYQSILNNNIDALNFSNW